MVEATPVSSAMICCVRKAISAFLAVGRANTSSIALVWRLCVPPSTAARASIAVRTMLFSGCCAVRDTPAVWVWKRIFMRAFRGGAVAVAHPTCPDPTGSPELADLLEEVEMGVEEEGEPWHELVEVEPSSQTSLHVGKTICKGERQLLGGGSTGFPDVIAGDGDGVPLRHLPGAEVDHVDNEPQVWLGREDPLFLGDVLLENVVLQSAPECRATRHPVPRQRRAGRRTAPLPGR